MHYYRPEPSSIFLYVELARVDDVDDPEREVDDEEEADHLPARLPPELAGGVDRPLGGVSDEHCLEDSLEDDEDVRAEANQRLQLLKMRMRSEVRQETIISPCSHRREPS